jgi:AcrR family transcriptional regulator
MDPRTQRTREHVLEVAGALLRDQGASAVTFSTVSAVAKVARQTLYRLWGTPAGLLSDLLLAGHDENPIEDVGDGPEAYLRRFLFGVRDGLAQADAEAALAGLIGHATHDPAANEAMVEVNRRRADVLAAGIGALSPEDYSFVVGPLFFHQLIARLPVDDAFVERMVAAAQRQRPDLFPDQ